MTRKPCVIAIEEVGSFKFIVGLMALLLRCCVCVAGLCVLPLGLITTAFWRLCLSCVLQCGLQCDGVFRSAGCCLQLLGRARQPYPHANPVPTICAGRA